MELRVSPKGRNRCNRCNRRARASSSEPVEIGSRRGARRDARRDAARLGISAGRRVARHERVQLPEGSVVSQGPISGPCGPRNALEAGEGGAGPRVAESESRLGCQRSAWGRSLRQPASGGGSPRLPIAPRAAERGGARLGSYSFKLSSIEIERNGCDPRVASEP